MRSGIYQIYVSTRPNASQWATRRFTASATLTQYPEGLPEESEQNRLSGRIHILGMGNVGGFVAHALASRPSPPPITVMLQHSGMYENWLLKKGTIAVHFDGLDSVKSGFDVNVLNNDTWHSLPRGPNNNSPEEEAAYRSLSKSIQQPTTNNVFTKDNEDASHIDCLVLACKATRAVKAMASVKHRLSPDSTVLFLQNGMGVLDEVNSHVFPLPETRPNYVSGVFSHGLAQKGPFYIDYKGIGSMVSSPIPRSGDLVSQGNANEQSNDWAVSTKYLLRTMNLSQQLVSTTQTPIALLQFQLEKLAMNAVINSITALADCPNGEFLYNNPFTRVMRMILIEVSAVICALPELRDIPGIEDRFSPERLRRISVQLANKTSKNSSSMLQDMRAGRMLEVNYINGYIVKRGEELGIKCALNFMLVHLLLGKYTVIRHRERASIPVDLPDS